MDTSQRSRTQNIYEVDVVMDGCTQKDALGGFKKSAVRIALKKV